MNRSNIPYLTSNIRLAITLQARGHQVLADGVYKEPAGTVWYTFWNEDVAEDLRAWLEGRELPADLHELWYFYTLFQCVLHGKESDKMIIVSLMILGNRIKDHGIR